jgi:spermidine synthase
VGQLFEVFRGRPTRRSVAICGLGAGALTCYAQPGERWTIYEIDPAVVRVARDPRYFTFLRDCRCESLSVILGDARLRLRDAPEHDYGLIVLDAFSSDAVPVHLLTREALRLYQGKLAHGGLIAWNISNRYLDLDPVLASLARDADLVYRVRYDLDLSRDEQRSGKQPTIWAVMAAHEADLGRLADDPRWRRAFTPRGGGDVWADDFSNIIEHFVVPSR